MIEIEWLAPCVSEMVDAFNEQWWAAAYGPAHIVVDDYNLDDADLDWCIGLVMATLAYRKLRRPVEDIEFLTKMEWYPEQETDCLEATLEFLKGLRKIPEYKRYGEG